MTTQYIFSAWLLDRCSNVVSFCCLGDCLVKVKVRKGKGKGKGKSKGKGKGKS